MNGTATFRGWRSKAVCTGWAIAAFASAAPANASTLSLVGGDVLHGRVVGFTDSKLQFLSERFGPMVVEAQAIGALDADDPLVLQLKNGDRLVTANIKTEQGSLVFATKFGPATVRWDEISVIQGADNQQAAAALPSVPRQAAEPDRLPSEPLSRPQPPRNEIAASVSLVGNQTSSILGGVTRNYLVATRLSYSRNFDNDFSLGARVPVFYQFSRSDGIAGNVNSGLAGLGDVSLFAVKAIRFGDDWPKMQFVLSGTAPTGRASGPTETTTVGLSSGYWALGSEMDLEFPVNFGSFLVSAGYTQYWPRHDNSALPFREVDWLVGNSFQLNDAWSLIDSVSGAVLINPNSQQEPAYFSLSLSYASPSGYVLQPTFSKGLNFDAQDFVVGLGVSKRW